MMMLLFIDVYRMIFWNTMRDEIGWFFLVKSWTFMGDDVSNVSNVISGTLMEL